MTVDTRVPVIEYTGNGVITKFDWDWKMIEDSNINVLVDNFFVTNWNLQDMSVVFNTAPEDGAEIIIYRLTTLWMPENYRAFGRFHSEKTELSVDRAIMICQERGGRRGGNGAEGIVGAADLHMLRHEFGITVVSERGTDAFLDLWDQDGVVPPDPDDPDSSIIWGGSGTPINVISGGDNVISGGNNVVDGTIADSTGEPIFSGAYSLPNNTNGISASIAFRMDLIDGDPTEATAYYPNYNALAFAGWLNTDPNDNEYWMRVGLVGTELPLSRYQISDGDNNRVLDEEFQIRGKTINSLFGPFVAVYTYGDSAPSTRIMTFDIEICKDSGGAPDGNWVSRNVTLEAIFNES